MTILLIVQAISCKKFVEVPPPQTGLVNSTVFASDATATSALLGVYSTMMQDHSLASINTSLYAGMSADELEDFSDDASLREFYLNSINPSNTKNMGLWSNAYQYIYMANAILEGLASSTSVSSELKSQLRGEALFIRGFLYFYLVNLYGPVPLVLSTNYRDNASLQRTDRTGVYNQILKDLKEARIELPDVYRDADNNTSQERTRPNSYAALALLARVYLFIGDWENAEATADSVIQQSGLYNLNTDLNMVFLKNSTETIWQLQPVNPSFDTYEGNVFILTNVPSGAFGTTLSRELITSFEPDDLRRTNWIDSLVTSGQTFYYAFKYKISSASTDNPEYSTVLRLAEQYLILAESQNEQNKLSSAVSNLNIVRQRAGLPDLPVSDITTVRKAIMHERQTEFFTEWGHRWLDLKRTGEISNVLRPIKPNWNPTDSLYPVPVTEIKNDPNISQNPGY